MAKKIGMGREGGYRIGWQHNTTISALTQYNSLNFLLLNPQFPRTLSLPATAWKVYGKKQYLWLQDENTWQEQFARFNLPFVDVHCIVD